MSISIQSTLKSIAPNARAVSKIQARTSKRDNLDSARTKTVDKLNASKAFLLDPTLDEPDLVYKEQPDQTFSIGIKYGNRYLKDVIDGKTFVENIDKSEVADVLDAFAKCVANGDCDASIEKIMLDNVTAKNKKKH